MRGEAGIGKSRLVAELAAPGPPARVHDAARAGPTTSTGASPTPSSATSSPAARRPPTPPQRARHRPGVRRATPTPITCRPCSPAPSSCSAALAERRTDGARARGPPRRRPRVARAHRPARPAGRRADADGRHAAAERGGRSTSSSCSSSMASDGPRRGRRPRAARSPRDPGAGRRRRSAPRPTTRLADAVFAASHGNPFFAGEVVQSFVDGGAVAVDGGRARLVADAPAVQLRPSTALLRRALRRDVRRRRAGQGDGGLRPVLAAPPRRSSSGMTGQPADEVIRSFDRLVQGRRARRRRPAAATSSATPSCGRRCTTTSVRPSGAGSTPPSPPSWPPSSGPGRCSTSSSSPPTWPSRPSRATTAAAETLLDAGRAVIATAPLVAAGYHRRAVELLPVGAPQRAEGARRRGPGPAPRRQARRGRRGRSSCAGGARPRRRRCRARSPSSSTTCTSAGTSTRRSRARRRHAGRARVNLLLRRPAATTRRPPASTTPLASIDGPPASQLMAITHLVQYANHVGRVDVAADLFDRVDGVGRRAVADGAPRRPRAAGLRRLAPGPRRPLDAHLDAAAALRPDPASLSHGGSLEAARTRLHRMRGEWDEALELIARASLELEQRGTTMAAGLLRAAGARSSSTAATSTPRCGPPPRSPRRSPRWRAKRRLVRGPGRRRRRRRRRRRVDPRRRASRGRRAGRQPVAAGRGARRARRHPPRAGPGRGGQGRRRRARGAGRPDGLARVRGCRRCGPGPGRSPTRRRPRPPPSWPAAEGWVVEQARRRARPRRARRRPRHQPHRRVPRLRRLRRRAVATAGGGRPARPRAHRARGGRRSRARR